MTVFQSFLICFLLVVTVLNILRIRRKKSGYANYRREIDKLKEKAKTDLKGRCTKKLLMYPFMSDSSDYYLVGVEEKRDLVAIITASGTYAMKISTPKQCSTVLNKSDNNRVSSVLSRVSCSDLPEELDIYFSRKSNRKGSYFCKLAEDNSEEFNNRILNPLNQS